MNEDKSIISYQDSIDILNKITSRNTADIISTAEDNGVEPGEEKFNNDGIAVTILNIKGCDKDYYLISVILVNELGQKIYYVKRPQFDADNQLDTLFIPHTNELPCLPKCESKSKAFPIEIKFPEADDYYLNRNFRILTEYA